MRQSALSSRARRWALSACTVAALAGLAACSSSPTRPEPAPLTTFTPRLAMRPVWQAQLPEASAPMVTPAAAQGLLALSDRQGHIRIVRADTGAAVWTFDAQAVPVSGLGFDGETLALVSQDNELLVFAQARLVWRQRLTAPVLTAPLVAGRRVFVVSTDHSVRAFDGATGARLWYQESRSPEALVLQQPGLLTAVGDTLVLGVGGRLVGLDPLKGSVRWEVAVASPRGVNEIERLVELSARFGRVDDTLCLRAYQASVACVDAGRGRLMWSRPAQGSAGLDADSERVFGVESNGRVLAWDRARGEPAWSTDSLLNRARSAPLLMGRSVVIAGLEGYLHLLSRDDGSLLNRLPTDGSPLVGAPLLVQDTLVVQTQQGAVLAWRSE